LAATTTPGTAARLPEPSGAFTASRIPSRTTRTFADDHRGPSGIRVGGISLP
jgi:hypothetical protein